MKSCHKCGNVDITYLMREDGNYNASCAHCGTIQIADVCGVCPWFKLDSQLGEEDFDIDGFCSLQVQRGNKSIARSFDDFECSLRTEHRKAVQKVIDLTSQLSRVFDVCNHIAECLQTIRK